MARNFEQACKQAAKQDNGIISKEEEKTLKKVHIITARFIKDLDKLSNKDYIAEAQRACEEVTPKRKQDEKPPWEE